LTISAKNVVFVVSNDYNEISPFLAPPWKNIFGYPWKIHYWPSPWKKSFRRPWLRFMAKHC